MPKVRLWIIVKRSRKYGSLIISVTMKCWKEELHWLNWKHQKPSHKEFYELHHATYKNLIFTRYLYIIISKSSITSDWIGNAKTISESHIRILRDLITCISCKWTFTTLNLQVQVWIQMKTTHTQGKSTLFEEFCNT